MRNGTTEEADVIRLRVSIGQQLRQRVLEAIDTQHPRDVYWRMSPAEQRDRASATPLEFTRTALRPNALSPSRRE